MTGERIRVTVEENGTVVARNYRRGLESRPGRLALDGLDSRLVHHFGQWLSLRDRSWLPDEIQSFGMLLHRCLFPAQPYDVWAWIRQQMADSNGEAVRLTLRLPEGRPRADLAAIPWEYLHTPGSGPEHYFLARHPGLVLSRFAPPPPGAAALPPLETLTVLPVVSDPSPDRLGPVEADEVQETLAKVLTGPRFQLRPVVANPDAGDLARAVAAEGPDVVHYMGHGRFDPDTRTGALALRAGDPGRRYEWVDEHRVAAAMCPAGRAPRVVVLHTCEGGRADTTFHFAGLAPALISHGVQCVVAMQYPIRNDTASAFSTELYTRLSGGAHLDEAVQAGRDALTGPASNEPRLIGVPVLYQHRADPVLAKPMAVGGDRP